jgi:two-component system sensor histidine kinase/response regulator
VSTQPKPTVLDRELIFERVGDDPEFLVEIADVFLEDCPKLLSDIRTAISQQDARRLEHAAHTLKGSVANFGAEPARAAAFRLEVLGRTGKLAEAPDACQLLEGEIERFNQALVTLARQLAQH